MEWKGFSLALSRLSHVYVTEVGLGRRGAYERDLDGLPISFLDGHTGLYVVCDKDGRSVSNETH